MAQFSVPRSDDFTIGGYGVTFREESNGSRTLKGGGLYRFEWNSGFYTRGNSFFIPVIEIKNAQGLLIHTITNNPQKIPLSDGSSGMNWNFSYSENFPYSILKDEPLSVSVKFVSGRGSYKPRYPDGTECNKNCPSSDFDKLLSSNIRNSSLTNLVNVEEETRLKNIETERLAVLETKRLTDIENKRLADIEKSRILKLQDDKLLLDEIRFNPYFQVEESRYLELLKQNYDELESFYEIDESSKVESIPSLESIESIQSVDSIDSMSKQIPLETATPILLVLGIGLVSYYLLKGNKK